MALHCSLFGCKGAAAELSQSTASDVMTRSQSCWGPQTEARAKSAWSAGAMDETAAAYLHERELPYFTMFGQGSRPYKDLEGKPWPPRAELSYLTPLSQLP